MCSTDREKNMNDIYNYGRVYLAYNYALNQVYVKKLHISVQLRSVEKVLIPMNGIPKGLCSFGRVQRQRLWWGVGQSPTNSLKALRKG